jgi:hypothetical protein
VLVQLLAAGPVLGGEHALQPAPERALVDPLREDRAGAAVEQQLLHEQRAVEVRVEAAVQERDALDLDLELPLRAPREQLLADAHAVVVRYQRGARHPVVTPERLGQVRLLVDRVVVRGRLVAVAEAEEVEEQQPAPLGQFGRKRLPVVGAGREPVQDREPGRGLRPLRAREQLEAPGPHPLAPGEPTLDAHAADSCAPAARGLCRGGHA